RRARRKVRALQDDPSFRWDVPESTMAGVRGQLATHTALSVLAAMTCGAPAVCGQMAAGDSGARPVILTFSYTGELVQNAGGGARRGTTFAGAAGVQFTLLLGQLVGWRGARIFVFALGTHGGAPSDLVGDVQGVSNLETPPPARCGSRRRGCSRTCSTTDCRGS